MKDASAGVKRILVVEDEAAIGEICAKVLTSEGLEVDIAADGKAAEDKLQEICYDSVLIDIRIPGMSGKELYQSINKKHPKLANRVILTTGDVVSPATQSFLEQAARPFLLKPFTPDELKTIVRETLQKTESNYQTSTKSLGAS